MDLIAHAAARSLLGAGHDHGADEGVNAESAAANEGSTLVLRVAAIFVILAVSLLFGLPPIFLRWFQSPDATSSRLLRAFAGGIILGLALIHIAPEAIADMDQLGLDFPVGGATILGGLLLLVVAESALMAAFMPAEERAAIIAGQHSHALPAHSSGGRAHHHHHKHDGGGEAHGHHHQGHEHGGAVAAQGPGGGEVRGELDAEAGWQVAGKGVEPPGSQHGAAHAAGPVGDAAAAAAGLPHTHQCMRTLSARALARSDGGGVATPALRQYVTAYTMELGCIFHSVIIGVGIGTITSGRSLVVTLMVAIAVHQGLESLALASVLMLTGFSRAKKAVMLIVYSVTTPLGIAIGIAVSAAYDPGSTVALAVQGVLNGVSSGMLLYISMYQLIGEEFSREDLLVRPRLLLGMHAALLAGAGVMALLAVWA